MEEDIWTVFSNIHPYYISFSSVWEN